MIDMHQAIYALNPSIVIIRGDVAYDANEQEVSYDKNAAIAKHAEMQFEEQARQAAAIVAKETALSKLAALGLTEPELKSLIG